MKACKTRYMGRRYESLCDDPGCGHTLLVHKPQADQSDQVVCSLCEVIAELQEWHAAPRPVEVVVPEAGGYLTSDEFAVIEHLNAFINGFRALDQFHFADIPEAVVHVHALQNMVMARAAQRAYADQFPRKP